MKLSQYLQDPDVVVKVRGVTLTDLGQISMDDVEMEDNLAKRTVHGLITVASRTPYKRARSILLTQPRDPVETFNQRYSVTEAPRGRTINRGYLRTRG